MSPTIKSIQTKLMRIMEADSKAKKDPCWDTHEMVGTKKKNGKKVPNCVPKKKKKKKTTEAVHNGRKVKLNKPTAGDTKKKKVYVNSGRKNKDGEIVAKKVEFGDPDMKIRKNNPKARKSFRARHNCDEKKDKTTAGYWSCRAW